MKANHIARAIRFSLLCVATLLLVAPLVLAFSLAVRPIEEVYALPLTWLPDDIAWSNFLDAVERLPFVRFMLNSMVISTASVLGAVLTSAMAGYAFARLQWHGKRICILLLFCALVVPAQVLFIPRFIMFSWLGWVGTYKPLIVPAWLGGGAFNVFLLWQFFRMIPCDFDDAARLDGASHWMVLTRVMMPIAKPGIATVALLSFVYHWQDFQRPLIYLSDFQTYPVALGLRMYQATGGSWMNLTIAASLVALLPICLVFAILQHHIARPARVTMVD